MEKIKPILTTSSSYTPPDRSKKFFRFDPKILVPEDTSGSTHDMKTYQPSVFKLDRDAKIFVPRVSPPSKQDKKILMPPPGMTSFALPITSMPPPGMTPLTSPIILPPPPGMTPSASPIILMPLPMATSLAPPTSFTPASPIPETSPSEDPRTRTLLARKAVETMIDTKNLGRLKKGVYANTYQIISGLIEHHPDLKSYLKDCKIKILPQGERSKREEHITLVIDEEFLTSPLPLEHPKDAKTVLSSGATLLGVLAGYIYAKLEDSDLAFILEYFEGLKAWPQDHFYFPCPDASMSAEKFFSAMSETWLNANYRGFTGAAWCSRHHPVFSHLLVKIWGKEGKAFSLFPTSPNMNYRSVKEDRITYAYFEIDESTGYRFGPVVSLGAKKLILEARRQDHRSLVYIQDKLGISLFYGDSRTHSGYYDYRGALGDSYSGRLKNGLYHGRGVYVSPPEELYLGEGEDAAITKRVENVSVGKWEENEFIELDEALMASIQEKPRGYIQPELLEVMAKKPFAEPIFKELGISDVSFGRQRDDASSP